MCACALDTEAAEGGDSDAGDEGGVGAAALLDALAVAVAERLGTEGTERLQSLHRMKKDYFPDG